MKALQAGKHSTHTLSCSLESFNTKFSEGKASTILSTYWALHEHLLI